MNAAVKKASMATMALGLVFLISGCGSSAAAAGGKNKPLVIVSGPSGTFQENFNPYGTALVGTAGLIYQPLFYFNPNTSKVSPILGQSYQWSHNNTVLTVNLRKGVRWSNGQPFTAADVAFTFNYQKQYPQLDTSGVWSFLSGVKAVNSSTVVFSFKKPDVPMDWYVLGQTSIIPKSVWSKISSPTKTRNTHPIGTGPYVLHSFNTEQYTFSANPRYWGGKPKVKQIDFPAYSNGTSIAGALAQGKIDWASIFMPNIKRSYLKVNPKYNHYWFNPSSTLMLYTSFKNSLLAQLPVRKAISLAINRTKINGADYHFAPSANAFDLLLPANRKWLPPSMLAHSQLQYSPRTAQAVLKKAGYKKNASGIFVSPSGKPLSFTLQVVSTYPDWVSMASIISSELGRVGIKVTVRGESASLYDSKVLSQHNYQLALSWTDTGPTPFYSYYAMLYPHQATNSESWSNAATTHWLNTYMHTNSSRVQHQAVAALAAIVAKKLPSVPLVETPTWFEYRTQHFTGWPTASNPYAQGGPWLSPSNGLIASHLQPK